MPPPRFSVKPPVKLKKANVKKNKDSGAIVRDSSAKSDAKLSCVIYVSQNQFHDMDAQLYVK